MPTKYFVIFCILLSVPLFCLIGVVAYCCFKVGVTEGIIALAVGFLIVAVAAAATIIKVRKRK